LIGKGILCPDYRVFRLVSEFFRGEHSSSSGSTVCSPVLHVLFFLPSCRVRHILSCFFVVIVLSLPCSGATAVSIET
ncbi:MAG: hypothetical protein ACTSRA_19545, partial [Promethearchaeota archaeon]